MAVQHVYSNTVANGTDTGVVRPSDWNSYHNQYITIVGNTSGQSTMSGTNIAFAGGNGITLSANTVAGGATISVHANTTPDYMYIGGNTTGSATNASTLSGDTFFLNGGSNITISNNAGTLVFNGQTNALTTAMVSNAGSNFLNASGAFNGTNITGTIGSNGLSLSVNAGGAGQTLSHWMPFPMANNTSIFLPLQNIIYMQGLIPDGNYAVSNVEMMFSLFNVSTGVARTNAQTIRYGLYGYGTGASSQSIQSIATSSFYLGMSNNSSTTGGFTVGNSVASFTTGTNGGSVLFNSTAFFGPRYLYLPFTTTLQAGQEYFWAMHNSSATTGGSQGLVVNMIIQTNMAVNSWGEIKFSTANIASTNQWEEYDGIAYSATSAGLLSAAHQSQFSQMVNKGRMWMIFENEA